MNRYFLAIVVTMLVVGCRQSASDEKTEKNTVTASASAVMQTVRRQLPYVGAFNQITNVSDFDIVFTEGDYNVELEAPEALADALHMTLDSGVLTLSQLEEGKSSTYRKGASGTMGTIYVSCPELRMLAVCGSGSFRSEGTIHTPQMHVGTLSLGAIEMDSVVCEGTFIYETSNDGDAIFRHIQAGSDVTFFTSDNGTTTAHVNTPGTMVINSGNKAVASFKGRAAKVEAITLGQATLNIDVDTEMLELTAVDKSTITIGQGVKQRDINKSSTATVI